MKKNVFLLLVIIPLFFLAGCLKDSVSKTYTLLKPVYKEKQTVINEIAGSAPRKLEEAGKIYVYGNYLFVNEINKGVHIIDNSNPENPVNKAFINIPGNVDIAVKGNILLADIFTDMLSINISNPLQPKVEKLVEGVFPERRYMSGFVPQEGQYIVDWIRKDTTVDYYESINRCWGCGIWFDAGSVAFANSGGSVAKATVGIAGSMSRFSIVNDYLYAVNLSNLNVIDIDNPAAPVLSNTISLGWDIETIYPFQDKLFIGSATGMFIYSIVNPAVPERLGSFSHARACDPVITDGTYAYVTLRSGSICGATTTSRLEVLNVQTPTSPSLLKTYEMTNPYGLGKWGDLLWICDGTAGLKVYNAVNPLNLKLVKHIKDVEPYDVIPLSNTIIVSTKEGIKQYAVDGSGNISVLSTIKK